MGDHSILLNGPQRPLSAHSNLQVIGTMLGERIR